MNPYSLFSVGSLWNKRALSHDKTTTLLLIFSCILTLLPFYPQCPWWLNIACGMLLAWRIKLTISGQKLPPKWLLLSVTIVLSGGIYWQFQQWVNRDTSIAFLVVLSCLKLLEMHAKRDAMAVIFISYFLLAGQLLYSQSLAAALYLMLCLCFLFSTQQAFHYHELIPPLRQQLRTGLTMFSLCVPLAFILFLLFPRFQGPLWGKQPANPAGITGLSDFMEPGNIAELGTSDQIAFRVRLTPSPPNTQQLYWRAVVLNRFDGQRWLTNSSMLRKIPVIPPSARTITQRIIMEPTNQLWLFSLDFPVSLQNTGNDAIHITRQWELRTSHPIQDRLQYEVTSYPGDLLSPDLTETERNEALQLPAGYNPLAIKWAQQLRRQYHDPAQLAQRLLRYFNEQPFHYTLSPPPLGIHQIDDFMFITQAGFCEHYASAFVFLMRAMHVPARVVTGYQGGEYNTIDGLVTIRQSDAHAWAEIWLEQHGWFRIDPTTAIAPDRVQHGLIKNFSGEVFSGLIGLKQHAWLSRQATHLRAVWDAASSAWNVWGINYNWSKQKILLSQLGVRQPAISQLPLFLAISASLLVALLGLLLLRKQNKTTPLDKVYSEFCHIMQRNGLTRQPNEGPLDFCQRCQIMFPSKIEISNFLHLYSRCKYGKEYNSPHLTVLKSLLKQCRHPAPPP